MLRLALGAAIMDAWLAISESRHIPAKPCCLREMLDSAGAR
jgi:hypothetical protein